MYPLAFIVVAGCIIVPIILPVKVCLANCVLFECNNKPKSIFMVWFHALKTLMSCKAGKCFQDVSMQIWPFYVFTLKSSPGKV